MDESWKGIAYLAGLIVVLYLLIQFILPGLIKILALVLTVILWGAIIFLALLLISYVVKLVKNQ
jgi:hypothetical protein